MFWSFFALGIGLLILAALQTFYGLWPLRRVRNEVADIRSGDKTRIGDDFPAEIRPLTEEINQLLAHSEAQAEEARRHAVDRMIANATTMGANAVVMMRFDSSETARTLSQILARGPAVGLEPA